MNVQIKHNNSDITTSVISYETENRICTGIGTMTLVVDLDSGITFDPWDSISLYENGHFVKKFYVSERTSSVPAGTITVQCQDNSKRLVDHFISESFVVDYPSYARTWIEYFLTQAGVEYQFLTESYGNLLSNFTSLGLTHTYDQVVQLLQLNGWYMYFDGNGKLYIGTLDTELDDYKDNLTENDILEISVKSDDKMLRNRVIVWGGFDPIYNANSIGIATVHTPWNYDHNDLRTIVISNSNIPNAATAYTIAGALIQQFARITVEKHMVLEGARPYNLGEILLVHSRAFVGSGMITTYGTSMSRNGLVTNVILDERCPRLFGYFNFGDSVYVGTYGDGIKKKHIRFDPTWYDFSTGIEEDDMAVTDLHINKAVFSCVTASGNMYYTIGDVPWKPLIIETLTSSLEADISKSGVYTPVPFSGLMARATIVDKEYSNRILYGIDTASGVNYGDYFLAMSGYFTTTSGVVASSGVAASGNRSWLVVYDLTQGTDIYDEYEVQISGNYNITVVDVENNGISDFLSVAEITEGDITGDGNGNFNYGKHESQPYGSTYDTTERSVKHRYRSTVNENQFAASSTISEVANRFSLMAIDNSVDGESAAVSIGKDGKAREHVFTRIIHPTLGILINRVSTTSPASGITTPATNVIGIGKVGTRLYRVFWRTVSTPSTTQYNYHYKDWDANSNTWGSTNDFHSFLLPGDDCIGSTIVAYGGKIYDCIQSLLWGTADIDYYTTASHMYFSYVEIDIQLGSGFSHTSLDFESPQDGGGNYYHFQSSSSHTASESSTFLRSIISAFQSGEDIEVLGFLNVVLYNRSTFTLDDIKEYIVHGNLNVLQYSKVYEGTSERYPDNYTLTYSRTSRNSNFICGHAASGKNGWFYTGATFSQQAGSGGAGGGDFPFYLNRQTIHTHLGGDVYYMAYDSSGPAFYLCDTESLTPISEITPPDGYTLNTIFSSPIGTGFSSVVYAAMYNNTETRYELIPYTVGGTFATSDEIHPGGGVAFTSVKGINFGNFFISEPASYSPANPLATVAYIYLGEPETSGVRFLVLRRNEEDVDWDIIEVDSLPIRIDISNYNPLLTITSGADSFTSNFIYDDVVTVVDNPLPPASGVLRVEDYRYTYLEVDTPSGLQLQSSIVAAVESGIYTDQVSTLSGWEQLYTIPSGYASRIEATNVAAAGQYIFVTTSGNNPQFFQKDPGSIVFTAYSGLPFSRATIIRVDDRF